MKNLNFISKIILMSLLLGYVIVPGGCQYNKSSDIERMKVLNNAEIPFVDPYIEIDTNIDKSQIDLRGDSLLSTYVKKGENTFYLASNQPNIGDCYIKDGLNPTQFFGHPVKFSFYYDINKDGKIDGICSVMEGKDFDMEQLVLNVAELYGPYDINQNNNVFSYTWYGRNCVAVLFRTDKKELFFSINCTK